MNLKLNLPQLWIEWMGLATILVVALFAFSLYPVADARRWGVVGLMVLFIAAHLWPPEYEIQPGKFHRLEHGRLAFLTLLSLGMVALHINFTAIIILYFVLSGRALFLFPDRIGYAWVLLLGTLTTSILTYMLWPNWLYGFLNGLGSTCGYIFVGSAANAQRRAEVASTESRRLLQELQTAHEQLQAYATRAEELAVVEERNRLAREMHDTLGHRLTVAAVQLEGAQKLVNRDPAKAITIIGTVREQVLEGLRELRRTVAALRTPLEEELPLRSALTRLASNFMEATGIQTELTLPATIPDLPADHRLALYRTAQEALTNVQRHAAAKQAHIEVALVDNQQSIPGKIETTVQISIQDDGVGIEATTAANGYGLRGLAERATYLGGDLLIQPRPGGGTRLVMRLPLFPTHSIAVTDNGVLHG